MIGTSTPQVIFPLLVKPLNDKDSALYPNRYWAEAASSNSATFGSSRGERRHAGRDLYGKELETAVVAMCDGIVLYNNSFYNATNEVVILHATRDGRRFIIRYGEVSPFSVKVKVGEQVVQGQEIAKIGRLTPAVTIDCKKTNMLHLEYYEGSAGFDLRKALTDRNSFNAYKRRTDIADPLNLLIEGYNNTFNIA
ncbi:MAG: M23 family metallopeptidase [Candidatus Azobacteroides sp.]|nr:M23 family metallopeptidase [Candidatus Azobacteroides sp.]